MRLFTGTCSSDFINAFGFEVGFSKIKRCGFDNIEIDLTLYSEQLLLGEKEIKDFFSNIKKLAEKNQLKICQTYLSFKQDDHSLRSKLAENAVVATSILSCSYAIIKPIILDDAENTYVKNYQLNLEFYSGLKALAQNLGVKIAIPNTAGYNELKKVGAPNACSSAGKILHLLDALGDNFCACLDTSSAYYVGQRPCETIKILGDKLKVLRLSDNDGLRMVRVAVTGGHILWKDLVKALKEIHFSGVFTFTPDYTLSGQSTLLYLGRLMNAIGNDFITEIMK